MSMNELQMLYNREKQELDKLKEQLDKALSKKRLIDSDYKSIDAKIKDYEDIFQKNKAEKQELLSKYNKIELSLFLGITVIFSLLTISLMLGTPFVVPLFIWNVLKIQIFGNIQAALILTSSIVGSEALLFVLGMKFLPNFVGFLENKIYNYFDKKVVNSKEYIELIHLNNLALELYEREKKTMKLAN